MFTQLDAAADKVIAFFKSKDITVMRYDAYTTNSIYLKLDNGVLGTIRISDHPGKKHLKYKYNLMMEGKRHTKIDKGVRRHYYPVKEMQSLLDIIMEDYQHLQRKYGPYKYLEYMDNNRMKGQSQKGFWQQARYV